MNFKTILGYTGFLPTIHNDIYVYFTDDSYYLFTDSNISNLNKGQSMNVHQQDFDQQNSSSNVSTAITRATTSSSSSSSNSNIAQIQEQLSKEMQQKSLSYRSVSDTTSTTMATTSTTTAVGNHKNNNGSTGGQPPSSGESKQQIIHAFSVNLMNPYDPKKPLNYEVALEIS